MINVDGSNEKMVIEEDDDFADKLSWSPGGSMIYFISYRTGNYDIYSISASGGGLQNLTNSPENEGQFVISPEGSKIAFTRSIGFGPGDLFVMSTQGTNEVKVASNAELPIWSPDSTEIAFYNDATPGIAAVDTFGNNLRILDNLWSIPTDWK